MTNEPDPIPESSPSAASQNPKPTVGLRELVAAMKDKGLSARALAKLTGVPRSTIGEWLVGRFRPNPDTRRVLRDALGIDPAGWETVDSGQVASAATGQRLVPVPGHAINPEQLPMFATPAASDRQATPNMGLQAAMQALETANRGLEDSSLPVSDVTKLLTAKLSAAKTVASLSGELDASEMAAWKRGPEFRHLLNLAAESLKPYPEASRAYATALGVGHGEQARAEQRAGDATPVLCPSSPSRASLIQFLGYLTTWLGAEGQDAVIGARALDGIVYPLAGRERELAESDPQLARDISTATVKAVARLEASKIAHAPYESYCLGVASRLDLEAGRGDKLAAFRRDFGELAMTRAREAFG